ncbi:MAG TPA: hypothetical protein H9991_11950, partial [Candidatus Mailhella excrementigallinarum]|nr:hypothetical protein [Candidatus Mailhella excrementigallinarum]
GRARCRAERGVRASGAEMTNPRRMVMRHGWGTACQSVLLKYLRASPCVPARRFHAEAGDVRRK